MWQHELYYHVKANKRCLQILNFSQPVVGLCVHFIFLTCWMFFACFYLNLTTEVGKGKGLSLCFHILACLFWLYILSTARSQTLTIFSPSSQHMRLTAEEAQSCPGRFSFSVTCTSGMHYRARLLCHAHGSHTVDGVQHAMYSIYPAASELTQLFSLSPRCQLRTCVCVCVGYL